MSRLLLLSLTLAACGGDPPPAAVDAPSLPACTGANFDPCTDNSQCDSNNCRNFMGDGFQVCITMCTTPGGNECPDDSSGNPATCNNMLNCKPVGPNECEL